MSDVGGGLPPYTPKSGGTGLWARFLASPVWVKIAVPVAIVLLAVFVGVLIAQAGDDSSGSEQETEELLEELAEELADQEAAASTTTIPVTLPETTTTVPETTTTVPETTTTIAATTTTVPATTTTVPVAPTTVPATTTTTTVPATTTTTTTTTEPPPTEPPPTEPPPTEPPPTEAPPTEPPDTEAPDTEPPDTETPPTEPGLPPGALFANLDDLQSVWNSTAQGSSVAQITSWTPLTVLDRAVNVANLGGNLRLAAVTGEGGFVSDVVLAWLPLADESQQPEQNALFQDAFAVMVRTVNPGASSGQQADLAAQLGLSSEQPPFPEGAEGRAVLIPDRYQLEVVDIPGQDGPTTLIAATSASPR